MAQSALIIIDIQNDYFSGGAFELDGAGEAGRAASRALAACRAAGTPVVHVRHESVRPGSGFLVPGTGGADIHPCVAPAPGEPVLTKHYPNSFRETGLEELLRGLGVEHLYVAGMMTLMCVDATVRQAFDLGFTCTVLHDACAARALSFGGVEVSAPEVHAAFLAAMGMVYARVAAVDEAGLGGC